MFGLTILNGFLGKYEKVMRRASVLIEVFRINTRRIGVNNNSRRYHQNPMYRKRAYFKALKKGGKN